MTVIGYALSSEEHSAPELVEFAKGAERAGFRDVMVSDHFHPWVDAQGNSRISLEDYAVAMIDEVERPAHSRRRFTVGY